MMMMVVMLGGVGAYLLADHIVGGERLRAEAEKRISLALGRPIAATMGGSRLSFDGRSLVSLTVRDIAIADPQNGESLLRADTLRFGVRAMPLTGGRVELGYAVIRSASLDLSHLPQGPSLGLPMEILDADGIVAPDLVLEELFGSLRRLALMLRNGDTRRLQLSDVAVIMPAASIIPEMRLVDVMLRNEDGDLSLTGVIEAAGRTISFDGTSTFGVPNEGEAAELRMNIAVSEQAEGVESEQGQVFQTLTASLAAMEGEVGGTSRLDLDMSFEDAHIRLGSAPPPVISGSASLYVEEGSEKIEFDRVSLRSGLSRFEMEGAIGPLPKDMREGDWAYRYQFISRQSTLSSGQGGEPSTTAAFSLSGRASRDIETVSADEFRVVTAQGQVVGSAEVLLPAGQSPGLSLALGIASLPVTEAKAMWPWFAAPGARRWAQENIYGGIVTDSRLTLEVEPGFFGQGQPLNAEQLGGRFNVAGTRFDVAGTIPPVRNAIGSLELRGMDIDIALASGTIYTPNNRSVTGTNGRLNLRDSNIQPLFGDLDITIEGAADAVAELATYDPIDVSRFIDLAPSDLTGQVTGQVRARVPLQAGTPAEDLDWKVDLAYSDLAIAKPFEGQKVTEAAGTLVADPREVRISAKARLNGAPSEISMLEPLGQDKSGRQRNFKVELDDAARDALVGGLSTVLSGPITVDLALAGEGAPQRLVADLGRARLSLPWVGWSKGAGVPATATFALASDDGVTRISDFALRGETFGATGSMTFDGGGLVAANFPRFALNREDDASLALERRGSRYHLDVRGKSLDARSLIKTVDMASGFAGGGAGGEETGSIGVSVEAEIERVTGFHDEALTGVRIAYSGQGSTVEGLRATATTSTGQHFAVVDATAGENRRIELQAGDGGAMLRLLDIYPNMQAGSIALSLAGPRDGVLRGHLEARNFVISNEERLNSIVTSAPPGQERSLNQAVHRNIDVSQSSFEYGFARLEKGQGYLNVSEGVVRGPMVGSTFQGTLFDQVGEMNITGTFMPAYGLNRIFGEIPLIGQILGNGRDRGLIGITYRLAGKASEPRLQVNPLSVVAPGIFRSIFEFR